MDTGRTEGATGPRRVVDPTDAAPGGVGPARPVGAGRDVAAGTAAFLLTALVVTAVGVALRVGDLRAVQEAHGELGPDAREYLIIARQMQGFYWPTYREPLHPALIRVATWVVGPTQRAARMVSLTFSSVLVLVAALAGRRLYGTWPALVAGAVIAFSPDYLLLSTEGLRPELYSVLLLTFLALLAARPTDGSSAGGGSLLPVIFAGVTGGLLCLTQMTALVFVFPGLLLWALGRRRRPGRWSAALVSMVLVVLMVAPYLYVCHRYLGDSMIWINRHASWWHQREALIKRSGNFAAAPEASGESAAKAPGPPPGSASASRPPAGAVTATQYLIGERPLTEFLGRIVRGYGTIFYAYTAVFWVFVHRLDIAWLSRVAVVVGAAGFLGLLRSLWEGPRLPVAVALLSLLPVSFVVPVGAETRLFLHVLPLWVMWVAWGLAWLLKMARTGLSSGFRRLPRP